jgi:hypothetical protein
MWQARELMSTPRHGRYLPATLVRRKAGISEQRPLRFVRSCSDAAQGGGARRPDDAGGRSERRAMRTR